MTTLLLPGLVDVHVHMREPGGEHKETWSTGTAAALAGGFTTVLAMPNTTPAVVDESSLDLALERAAAGARCDYAHYVGAGLGNTTSVAALAGRSAGLKMYLGETFGDLRLDDRRAWRAHVERWPGDAVIAVHAEGAALKEVILLAEDLARHIHVCHVAAQTDIDLIARAKEKGQQITCEVAPHHLFLDTSMEHPNGGRSEVRPRLGSSSDRRALWERLDIVDCFATDHAPHTAEEKDGVSPPPGFPGLETALPLLLTAVHEGLLELKDVVQRLHHRPNEIFGLSSDRDTWIEIDPDEKWSISAGGKHSRSGWTPFAGMPVRGRVTRVVLRGETAYEQESVTAQPGNGRDMRAKGETP